MFFRRQKPQQLTFQEQLDKVRSAGFTVEPAGAQYKVSRHGYAALIEETPGPRPRVTPAGLIVGKEVGVLVDAGYQKFFQTPTRKKVAAQAEHLSGIHDFEEDLREALGLVSLYNESLGSVCGRHMYDRVEDRDHGVPKRPWETVR